MRLGYRILLTAAMISSLAASAFAEPPKGDELLEKNWSSSGDLILSDVPEVEPNGSIFTPQFLGCGNVLRPASIAAVGDTDYVAFTALAGDVVTVGTEANGTTGQVGDTRIRVFNATLGVIAGDDDGGPGLYSLASFVASYTGTYYVGIAAFGAETGGYRAFINCVTPQPPPANDLCEGAIVIECGDINLQGTTQFAANNYTPLASGTGGCTGFTAAGRDVVYLINAAPGDILNLSYTTTADGSVYILSDCGAPLTSCVAGADDTLVNEKEVLSYVFTTAGFHYLVLDSFGTNTFGTWTATGNLECHPTSAPRASWGKLKTIYR